jgi:glycosyltransferase involved in cell wall biosynthesis
MDKNDNMKGFVSVGLPTYNRPDSLRRALEIITTQTYQHLEIIISDNSSHDIRVKEVVDAFLSTDARIKYFRQEQNTGVLANAEFVLKKSSGEYFVWFSDDDWRAPEFIEKLVAQLESNKDVNMAFCDYHEVYEDGSRALGYPTSHLQVYKPFMSRHRLVRTIAYFLQNAKRGKCNLFYSVFRKKILDTLDIKKISGEYTHLNMDCLIVFAVLQRGPVAIIPEAMCTLTCGNHKYYASDANHAEKSKTALLSKMADFLFVQRKDRDLYKKNTDSFIEKLVIYFAFVPKLIATLGVYAIGKYSQAIRGMGDKVRLSKDVASVTTKLDAKKLKLPNVTLVAMATRNVEETLQALMYSCREIEFGAVKLLSHFTPYGMDGKVEFVRIEKIKDIDEWSYKIVYELHQYIETDFALLVHADGFVVNPSAWRDEFLNYDYIGAPWPLPKDDFSYRDINGEIVRVGNSVSLRSKRLLELPKKLQFPWEPDHGYFNEDGFVCVKNKHIFEANGIRFSPLDVAKYFSHDAMIPELRNIKPFAFHKWAGSNRAYPKF